MTPKDIVAVIAGLILVGVAYVLINHNNDIDFMGWIIGLAGIAFIAKGIGCEYWDW